jgi:ABC-type branched-subunit amino acid transport system ATPase component
MLAIGRGLMSRPRLLLMDEPSLGLAPKLVLEVFDATKKINEHQNVTIFITEQNVYQVLRIAKRAYVLENGKIVLEGPSEEVLRNSYVKKAYLGL